MAILAVIGVHYGPNKVPGGFLGVDVFFVLSGFLITALLLQEREATSRVSLSSFYARRARRLLPALVLVLAAVAVYGVLEPHRPENAHVWRDTLAALFYVADFVQAAARHVESGMLSHTWSLSIEEQFYLVWPALLVLLIHRGASRRAIAWFVAIGAASTFADAYLLLGWGATTTRVQFGIDSRGGGLLIGCLLGLLVVWDLVPGRLERVAPAAAWIGLPVLAWAFLTPRYGFVAAQSYRQFVEAPLLVDLATAAVIFGIVFAPQTLMARGLSIGPMTWIGRVSYGLYLWHVPVGHVVSPGRLSLGLGSAGTNLVRTVVTLTIVTFSYYVVERPLLARRTREQSQPGATPSVARVE